MSRTMLRMEEFLGDVTVGAVNDVPPGEGRSFVVAGHRIAVFRGRDGSLRAVQAECPHEGGAGGRHQLRAGRREDLAKTLAWISRASISRQSARSGPPGTQAHRAIPPRSAGRAG